MKNLEVETKLDVYDGEIELKDSQLIVASHCSRDSCIVLNYKGEEYTLFAEELRKAIDNATNTQRDFYRPLI